MTAPVQFYGSDPVLLQLLAISGPFQTWSPVRQESQVSSLPGVDLLLGTSANDGLIARARRIKVRSGPVTPEV